MNALCSFFRWHGTLNRRDYLHHAALAAALFALGCYLQIRYEGAMAHALGIADDASGSLLFLLPLGVELVAALGSPFVLPLLLLFLITTADPLLAEDPMAMAAATPELFIGLFALATLLMLISGLRGLALASRRLRDAGLSLKPLVAMFGGLALLYLFTMTAEQPSQAALFTYLLALAACFIAQVLLLLRPTAHPRSQE